MPHIYEERKRGQVFFLASKEVVNFDHHGYGIEHMDPKFESALKAMESRFKKRIILLQRETDMRYEASIVNKDDADAVLAELPQQDVFFAFQILESNATDIGLKRFFRGNRASLEALEIVETQVTGQGICSIGKLPNLKEFNTDVVLGISEVLCWLGTLETVKSITIHNVPQLSEDFRPLQSLKHLERLSLTSHLTLNGLLGATFVPGVKDVELQSTTVSHGCFAEIAELKTLERLTIVCNSLSMTDASMLLKVPELSRGSVYTDVPVCKPAAKLLKQRGFDLRRNLKGSGGGFKGPFPFDG